jgi:hypothetical protein
VTAKSASEIATHAEAVTRALDRLVDQPMRVGVPSTSTMVVTVVVVSVLALRVAFGDRR